LHEFDYLQDYHLLQNQSLVMDTLKVPLFSITHSLPFQPSEKQQKQSPVSPENNDDDVQLISSD